jgi:anthranilate phosphoribosyltransferase
LYRIARDPPKNGQLFGAWQFVWTLARSICARTIACNILEIAIVFTSLLGRVSAGESLSMDEMRSAIGDIMQGHIPDGQIALFLTALREKGETVDEIAGAAAAMRDHMTPIRTARAGVLDTCGTGGTGSRLFNVSTAAAIVAAAAGVPVAKHGNRSVTSRSGSADVLKALGVNIQADAACVANCLDRLGICFCFAPMHHPAMKRVAEVRKQIGGRTIFNLLGPLSNPAGAKFQLLGTGMDELRTTLARALVKLGATRAVVVTGDDGLGEVTIATTTHATIAVNGELSEAVWSPDDFGVAEATLDTLLVDNADESAAIIRRVLAGEEAPARDIVVANAAAALWAARKSDDLKDCARQATEAISNGAAQELLRKLVEQTNRSAG